jgi:hypothetical protein
MLVVQICICIYILKSFWYLVLLTLPASMQVCKIGQMVRELQGLLSQAWHMLLTTLFFVCTGVL